MFFVLKEFFVALLLALLVSGGVVALIALMTNSTYNRYDFTKPKSLIILGLLLIFLFAESACLFGAWRIRRQLTLAWERVELTIDQAHRTSQAFTEQELAQVVRREVPEAERFVELGEAGIQGVTTTAQAYYQSLRSDLNWYIWKRVLWMLAATLIGGFLMIHDANQSSRYAASWGMYNLDDL